MILSNESNYSTINTSANLNSISIMVSISGTPLPPPVTHHPMSNAATNNLVLLGICIVLATCAWRELNDYAVSQRGPQNTKREHDTLEEI